MRTTFTLAALLIATSASAARYTHEISFATQWDSDIHNHQVLIILDGTAWDMRYATYEENVRFNITGSGTNGGPGQFAITRGKETQIVPADGFTVGIFWDNGTWAKGTVSALDLVADQLGLRMTSRQYNAHLFTTTHTAPRGDTNGDGAVDFGDLTPFVTALTSPDDFQGIFPVSCDLSRDDLCNFADLTPFANALTGGGLGSASVPEPSALWLAVMTLAATLGYNLFAASILRRR